MQQKVSRINFNEEIGVVGASVLLTDALALCCYETVNRLLESWSKSLGAQTAFQLPIRCLYSSGKQELVAVLVQLHLSNEVLQVL